MLQLLRPSFGIGALALAVQASLYAQGPFSLSYATTEEWIVEIPDARLVDSLSDYELAGIQYRGPVESTRVMGYDAERGLYVEKTYADPSQGNPDWIETPVAKLVEGGGSITAYGPAGETIATHVIAPQPTSARTVVSRAAESGDVLPFRLSIRPTDEDVEALRAEGYAVTWGQESAVAERSSNAAGGLPGDKFITRLQGTAERMTARAEDHALIYDGRAHTTTSVEYDANGNPHHTRSRAYRKVPLPSADTAYLTTSTVTASLDTLLSGMVVTRIHLVRNRNHAYTQDGVSQFDLGKPRGESAPGGGLVVFPNPLTTNRLQVVVPEGLDSGDAVIELYDATGRLLSTQVTRLTPGGLVTVARPRAHSDGVLVLVLHQGGHSYREVVVTPTY